MIALLSEEFTGVIVKSPLHANSVNQASQNAPADFRTDLTWKQGAAIHGSADA